MATTTETTTTTTRSERVTDSATLEHFRRNMRQVSEGLQDVRTKAREELDAIDRLAQLLDADAFAGLLTVVETLEERVSSLEGEKEALSRETDKAGEELDAEKARLTKLWDAYKSQEDELRRAKRDEPILKEKLADRERHISELEDSVARLQAMETYKERYQSLKKDHERLEGNLQGVERDLRERNQTIADLEAKAEQLKSYEEDSRRVKELERQLSEEKERLAKLYKVYEDTEGKLKDTEDEAARWRQWYDRHRQAFEMVGDAAQYPVKTAED